MDVDDDDDFYGNDEEVTEKTEEPAKVEPEPQPPVVKADDNEDLEEGEEEDEGDDDSVRIVVMCVFLQLLIELAGHRNHHRQARWLQIWSPRKQVDLQHHTSERSQRRTSKISRSEEGNAS